MAAVAAAAAKATEHADKAKATQKAVETELDGVRTQGKAIQAKIDAATKNGSAKADVAALEDEKKKLQGKVNAAEGQKLIADADEAKAEKTQEDAVAKTEEVEEAEEAEEAEEELLWASPPVALPLPLPLGLPFTW